MSNNKHVSRTESLADKLHTINLFTLRSTKLRILRVKIGEVEEEVMAERRRRASEEGTDIHK